VTSPTYYGLRRHTDSGTVCPGQTGAEATPAEWLEAMLDATAELVRVLKASGSLWAVLGDKDVADSRGSDPDPKRGAAKHCPRGPAGHAGRDTAGRKSLLGLPWRHACACTPTVELGPDGRAWRTGDLTTGRRACPTGPAHTERARRPRGACALASWDPAPSRPALVLGSFGRSGGIAMVARAHGRLAVSLDVSFDHAHLTRWRVLEHGGAQRLLRTPRADHLAAQLDLLDPDSGRWR
jgi:hypothetical protein